MAVSFITGEDVLAFVGSDSVEPVDTEWAAACALAINEAINHRLNDPAFTDESIGFYELRIAARIAGGEAYKRKEATFGVTGYADLQGAAIRVAKDYIEGIRPIINRYAIGGGVGVG